MVSYARRTILLASTLSLLAGYLDSIGFQTLGGFFLSFMSGNSTRLGISAAELQPLEVLTSFGIIVLFVIGVVISSLIGDAVKNKRRSKILTYVLTMITAGAIAQSFNQTLLGAAFIVLSMGAINAVFERDGDVAFGISYMTGSLVKAGRRIALALQPKSESKWEWVPYICLWIGLVLGASLGVIGFNALGPNSLWPATIWVLAVTLIADKLP